MELNKIIVTVEGPHRELSSALTSGNSTLVHQASFERAELCRSTLFE